MPIDAPNRKLLSALRRDARAKYAELGKTVNLSAPAVFERVKKLEGSGVIQRYTVELDPTALGLPFCAFVQIATTGYCPCDKLAATLAAYPEVEECHSIAGENSVLVKVRTVSPQALDQLLGKMRRISGVGRTLTTVVLQTHFERGVQPPA
ncbi:MAG: Lrp/AsnC family transcriptional regulator [Verrucomicrobia bacterium]|nr:Lrp/AsnC family transcriptional regulator [Verrucomicrobiota bacterium]